MSNTSAEAVKSQAISPVTMNYIYSIMAMLTLRLFNYY